MSHSVFKQGSGFNKSGKENGGVWINKKSRKEKWAVNYNVDDLGMQFRLGLTYFKHIGVFPEQAANWDYIYKTIKDLNIEKPKVLNMFAYTGIASLAAKSAGADVVHLDSVRQVVTWARENMELSKLNKIHWVVEDALQFIKREMKRGNRYNGIILDPPAYGHGTKGCTWILEDNILEMLTYSAKVLEPQNSFLLLNLYSNGFSSIVADTLTNAIFNSIKKKSYGELVRSQ